MLFNNRTFIICRLYTAPNLPVSLPVFLCGEEPGYEASNYLDQLAMAAGHAELLALAQKITVCECWDELLPIYMACKLLPRGIDGRF